MSRESSERSGVGRAWRGLTASSALAGALAGRYEALRVVGEGSFAQVILARHIPTGSEVAVKVLRKGQGRVLPSVWSELDIVKGVEHPHVVQVLEVVDTPGAAYLVMEHVAGGQLLQHIPKDVGLREEEARRVFGQLAGAVGYCHAQGIAHRDLKADNVLLDAAGGAKLCDFGLACRFRAGEKLDLVCGTPAYWAPELYRLQDYDGPAVDVWSLGVLLFLMLTGGVPFPGPSFAQAKEQVLRARYRLPSHLSPEARGLISWMLTVEPAHRPTLPQILGHPWLSRGQERAPSPPAELLPKRPDTSILLAMLDLGYGLQGTWVSVATRRFDEAMGTYLLLRRQKTRGAGCRVRPQPGRPRVGPGRSHSVPCSSAVGPRRSASGPVLRSWPLSARQPRPPEEHQPLGQRGSRRASLPAVAPCGLPASAPTPGPAAAPLPESSQALSTAPSSGSAEQHPAGTGTPGPTHDTARGWRRVARRVAACVARLCCCVQAPRTGPRRPNRVAPAPAPGGHAPPPAPADPPAAPVNGGQARRRVFKNRVTPWPAPS